MSLNTIVKISHVTNLSDARYCAGMGVEMLGFSVDESSKDFVSLQKLNEMRGWVTGVQVGIETTSSDLNIIVEKIETYNPDFIQITDPYLLTSLKSKTEKPIILSIEANQDADTIDIIMQKCKSLVNYFLLESNTIKHFDGDWPDFINLLTPHYPILLGFGISPQNVSSLSTAGIALHGGTEIRPGFSDFGELMDILEALEIDL